jgi:hypothetical protein
MFDVSRWELQRCEDSGLCWFMLGETTEKGLKDATPPIPSSGSSRNFPE